MTDRKKNLLVFAVLTVLGVALSAMAGYYGLESILTAMSIPILLAGFLLPVNYAVACAVITPILCTILLGAPALFPLLPVKVCETVALTSFASIFYNSLNWKIYPALLATIALGWLVQFSAVSILSWVIDGFNAIAYTASTLIQSIPGLLLQILLVPLLLKIIEMIRTRRAAQEL